MPVTETSEFNDLSFTNVIYLMLKAKAKQTTPTPNTNELKFVLLKVICKPADKHDQFRPMTLASQKDLSRLGTAAGQQPRRGFL